METVNTYPDSLFYINSMHVVAWFLTTLINVVIRPVLEYASPVWHHLITKKQSDEIEAIQKRAIRIIYRCAQDMPYASAIFLADLPTMSDRRDQLARIFFLNPQSTLYILLT